MATITLVGPTRGACGWEKLQGGSCPRLGAETPSTADHVHEPQQQQELCGRPQASMELHREFPRSSRFPLTTPGGSHPAGAA